MKQEEYIGLDTIACLKGVLKELNVSKVFLVTGRKSFSACGAKALLDEILKNYHVCYFNEFQTNPKIEDINRGIEKFGTDNFDVVIAVGGGSVIDMAKMINFLSAYPLTPGGYKIKTRASGVTVRPLIAIPTTSGSGSEATSFAVLYIDRKKYSVDNKSILPDIVIIDSALTTSLPKYIAATTGMDALAQAIESYWNINSNDESKRFAMDAIELIINNLLIAVNCPSSATRLAMAKAANLAGKAINITRTTAPHAISYPLTSSFDISHGQAVSLTLSALLVFNTNVTEQDVLDKRGVSYVRETIGEICKSTGACDVNEAAEKIDELIHQIGLETRLSSLGLKKEDIETIVNGFNVDRAKNNPRLLTKEALREILNEIY